MARNRELELERKRREAGMPAMGTPESTENRRNARKAVGPDHGNWKGDDVGYFGLHGWVDRHGVKTGRCFNCGDEPQTRTEWANVSGEYRRDLADFVELCVSCHRRYDRGSLDLTQGVIVSLDVS